MTSTNYFNTLILVAEDCSLTSAEVPPVKGDKKTVAHLQFEMVYNHPYTYTSDEVLYTVWATRKGISADEWEEQRIAYFSKGQPCFRASPLTKRYGWGVHSDEEGRIALYGVGSEVYQQLQNDDAVEKTSAMRSKRK